MTRLHDRARFGAVRTVLVFARSAYAMTREPMPTPRHARQPHATDTPRSAR